MQLFHFLMKFYGQTSRIFDAMCTDWQQRKHGIDHEQAKRFFRDSFVVFFENRAHEYVDEEVTQAHLDELYALIPAVLGREGKEPYRLKMVPAPEGTPRRERKLRTVVHDVQAPNEQQKQKDGPAKKEARRRRK